ncbi:MAG: hypothetical protein JWO36_3641 [Myxococcales bacterium]|nr:hypothetical protein [Myxococcales bacterium]
MYGPAMATTVDSPKQDQTSSFAEHDKLGPLGAKASVLDNPTELRRMLVAEFLAAANAAKAAAGGVDRSTHTAVHDYRKALRRARAVLSLVSAALPKSERRAVRQALQEARRTLGIARDHAVAPDTLAQLPLGDPERETANLILHNAEAAMPQAAEIKQLLAEGAARAAAQVEALEAALPEQIEWSTIVRGIRRVYGDARSARKGGKRSKRSFHTWRRRSKELGYQLQLLAGYSGIQVSELYAEIDGATDPQAPAVDLIMVRSFVQTYNQGVSPESFEHLMWAIDGQLEDVMKAGRRAGREAFRRTARKFGRRLTKAVRRDHAPPDQEQEVALD